jgi:hypothetical protein
MLELIIWGNVFWESTLVFFDLSRPKYFMILQMMKNRSCLNLKKRSRNLKKKKKTRGYNQEIFTSYDVCDDDGFCFYSGFFLFFWFSSFLMAQLSNDSLLQFFYHAFPSLHIQHHSSLKIPTIKPFLQ